MTISRDCLIRALSVTIDYEVLPTDLQIELVRTLSDECDAQIRSGAGEAEALSHGLAVIKAQAARLLSRTNPGPRSKPYGPLALSLALLGIYFPAVWILQHMKFTYQAMGMERLPLLTDWALCAADFWPVTALAGAFLISLIAAQFHPRAALSRRMPVLIWVLICSLLVFVVCSAYSAILPLLITCKCGKLIG